MAGICTDSRFELINEAKKRLPEYTNIEDSSDFQMGDSVILAWRCFYPVTVSMFDCSNRQVVSA